MLLASALALAQDTPDDGAAQELDQELKALVKIPPPAVAVTFTGVDPTRYRLVDGSVFLDGEPVRNPEAIPEHNPQALFEGVVEPGLHTLSAVLMYRQAGPQSVFQSGLEMKIEGKVTFRADPGLEVLVKTRVEIRPGDEDLREKLAFVAELGAKMRARLEDGSVGPLPVAQTPASPGTGTATAGRGTLPGQNGTAQAGAAESGTAQANRNGATSDSAASGNAASSGTAQANRNGATSGSAASSGTAQANRNGATSGSAASSGTAQVNRNGATSGSAASSGTAQANRNGSGAAGAGTAQAASQQASGNSGGKMSALMRLRAHLRGTLAHPKPAQPPKPNPMAERLAHLREKLAHKNAPPPPKVDPVAERLQHLRDRLAHKSGPQQPKVDPATAPVRPPVRDAHPHPATAAAAKKPKGGNPTMARLMARLRHSVAESDPPADPKAGAPPAHPRHKASSARLKGKKKAVDPATARLRQLLRRAEEASRDKSPRRFPERPGARRPERPSPRSPLRPSALSRAMATPPPAILARRLRGVTSLVRATVPDAEAAVAPPRHGRSVQHLLRAIFQAKPAPGRVNRIDPRTVRPLAPTNAPMDPREIEIFIIIGGVLILIATLLRSRTPSR